MVSCGVRLSEVGLSDIRKPQVRSEQLLEFQIEAHWLTTAGLPALNCVHRTSTFRSCAFREQEDDLTAIPSHCARPMRAF